MGRSVASILIFVVIILLNIQIHQWESQPHLQSTHEWKILTWRLAYLSGYYSSNAEIAVKLFGKDPIIRTDLYAKNNALAYGESYVEENSYPFLTTDTLRVWIHW